MSRLLVAAAALFASADGRRRYFVPTRQGGGKSEEFDIWMSRRDSDFYAVRNSRNRR